MSATSMRLEWGVVVEDPDHWTTEHRAAAEAEPGGSYEDWVVEPLRAVMAAAGQAYIDAHPDLFRHNELF